MANPRNVLLILCDQLRADFLGVYGNTNGVTPNLDRLAESGMVFDRAYSVMPVCTPARMTMLTGRHPATCPNPIPESAPTIAGLLSAAGWHTAAFGKMHMRPPRGPCGFDELVLSEDTGPAMFLDDYHPWLAEQGAVEWARGLDNYDLLSSESGLPEEKTVTCWNGRQAVDFIHRQSGSPDPFYAVVSFPKPHPPYDPSKPWAGMVQAEAAPRPLGLDRPWDEYPEQARLYAEAFGFQDVERLGCVQQVRAHYLGLVAQIDHEIGRILDALAEQGLEENTLVIFLTDHGDFLGDHHLFMKFFPYESAAKIPLIMRGPGVPQGRSKVPVSHLDFVPTILEFLGQHVPAECQGRSLLDLLRTQGDGRDGVLIQFGHGRGFCWAMEKHKYLVWPNGEEELFDLAEDPEECHNLAEERADLRAHMRAALLDQMRYFDERRAEGMPRLLDQDGRPPKDRSYVQAYKGTARRFMPHRVPKHITQ